MRRRSFLVAAAVRAVLPGGGAASAQTGPPPAPTTTAPPGPGATRPPGVGLGPAAPPAGATTTAPPGAAPSTGGGEDSPGFFDVGGRVRKAINDWFRDLVTSAVEPVLDLLGRTVLATPPVDGAGRVQDLWRVSAGMANAFFVLFVVVGGAIVMGHETLQTRYSAKEIAPRLVVGIIAANTSLALAGLAIGVANAFSQAFLGQGIEPANATTAMRTLVLGSLSGGGIFLVLVGLVVAVLGVVLLATYIIRVSMVVVLVAAAPSPCPATPCPRPRAWPSCGGGPSPPAWACRWPSPWCWSPPCACSSTPTAARLLACRSAAVSWTSSSWCACCG